MARHNPACGTCEVPVLPFREALERSLAPCGDYDAGRWIYIPNFYSEYRYVLGTRGEHPLICIGINPSTARPDALDRTLQSVERIASNNGYDSFIMFNVYAQRATDPDDMEKDFNPAMHRENMEAFRYILSLSDKEPSVWAAWGSLIEKRGYLASCVRDMVEIGNEYRARWYTVGPRSVKGHPHHPLYLKSDSPLCEFRDILPYLEKQS